LLHPRRCCAVSVIESRRSSEPGDGATSRRVLQSPPMRSSHAFAAATVALLALAAAGCGGGSSSSSTTTSSTSTLTQTTSASNVGLTQAEWRSYIGARDKARSINSAAIKTYTHCSQLITSNPKISPAKVTACLGDTTSTVVSAGQQAIRTLTSFSGLAGACATARTQLVTGIQGYVSSVHAVGLAVQKGSVPGEQSAIQAGEEALKISRTANTAFEQACKPTA
jgi:hypothetical protein